MIADKLVPLLHQSTAELFRTIGPLSAHTFNMIPVEGGWSAAQITEHILLMDIYIFRVMQKDLSFAGRAGEEKVETISILMSDPQFKQESPAFALPSGSLTDPLVMQERIGRERQLICNYLTTVGEDSLCGSYAHPEFGTLTITEWAHYIVQHTHRHIRQIEDLQKEIKD
jgi:hypothetical protein